MGCGGGGIILAKGLKKVGFSSRFFVALLALCTVRSVWAQCCACDQSDGCPLGKAYVGYVHQGTSLIPDCNASFCNGGCAHCCANYTASCPGMSTVFKCKESRDPCAVSGCTRYDSCNTATGRLGPAVSGECHLENDICYGNERSCNSFGNEVPNVSAVSCQTQTGQAVWNENKWNVSNCTCVSPVVSGVNGDLNCAEFGTSLNLVSNQSVTSVNDKVQYEIVRLYCNKCLPGYIPRVVHSVTDAGIGTRPDDNRDWGCMACDQVRAPNYALGCDINFDLLGGDAVVAACQMPCPDGFETVANGATSMDACQYDGQTTYTDGTGTFYINSLDECP